MEKNQFVKKAEVGEKWQVRKCSRVLNVPTNQNRLILTAVVLAVVGPSHQLRVSVYNVISFPPVWEDHSQLVKILSQKNLLELFGQTLFSMCGGK